MSFERSGLLGPAGPGIRRTIRDTFPDLFRVCEDTNALAHAVRNSIELDYENQFHLVVVCLLQKVLDSQQAMNVLMEVGLESDSSVVLRSVLESVFLLRKLSLDEGFLAKYLGMDQLHRRRLIRVTKNSANPAVRGSIPDGDLDSILADLQSDITTHGFSDITAEQMARECGLETWYDLSYRNLSVEVHSLPGSLKRYLVLGSDNRVVSFDFTPKVDRIEALLISACSLTLVALDSAERVFGRRHEQQIDLLHHRIVAWPAGTKGA